MDFFKINKELNEREETIIINKCDNYAAKNNMYLFFVKKDKSLIIYYSDCKIYYNVDKQKIETEKKIINLKEDTKIKIENFIKDINNDLIIKQYFQIN